MRESESGRSCAVDGWVTLRKLLLSFWRPQVLIFKIEELGILSLLEALHGHLHSLFIRSLFIKLLLDARHCSMHQR